MMEKVYARTKGIRDDMVVGFCPRLYAWHRIQTDR